MKSLKEQMASAPKFERATKTDVHYTGTINGKTWVVPHSFHGSHDIHHGEKTSPIRHSIVTSPVHVQHNNPTLKPEELARVHKHIKDIHGGQDPTHDSFGKLEEEKAVKGTPEYQAERDKYRHAALAASRKAATLAFAKRKHIIKETTWHVTDHLGHKHEVQAKDKSEAMKKTVSVGGIHKDGIPMTQWNKVKVQRKNLEEMELKGINVTASRNHPGKTKVYDPNHPRRDKQPRTSAKTSMKNFLKAITKHKLDERTLTPSETEKKEELVHKMKPKLQSFNDRYGKEGKSVMYAVATKQAKKLAEEPEQLDELSDSAKQFIHHREHYWKLAKGQGSHAVVKQMKVHSDAMAKHHKSMTPAEKHVAHTGSYVSSPSRRLQGGSAKEDKEYVHEGEQTMRTTKTIIKEVLAEMFTRKHFQQVADVIKAHPDAAKRHELATHHADMFAKQNPRFDHKRFFAAANAGEHKG